MRTAFAGGRTRRFSPRGSARSVRRGRARFRTPRSPVGQSCNALRQAPFDPALCYVATAMHTEVVRQVLSLAHQAVKETHRDRLEAYIRAYCRAIPPEVLAEVEPHHLLAFVMDRFAFLEEDWGRTVKVSIRDSGTTLLHDEPVSTVIETRLPD